MAKITVDYDTVTKALVVKQDGKELPNVCCFSVNKKYEMDDMAEKEAPEYSLYVSMEDDSMKEEGLCHYHSLQANEKGDIISVNSLLENNKKFFNQFLNRK